MPTAITGGNTSVGFALALAFDTPTAATRKMVVDSVTHGKGVSKLVDNGIGSGSSMQTSTDAGAPNPAGSIPKKLRYEDDGYAMLGQLMGSETVFSAGNGAYLHSFGFQASSSVAFGTLAFTATSSDVMEAVNAVITKASFKVVPNDYITSTFDYIATDERVTNGTIAPVNTASALNALSIPVTKNFLTTPAHYVRINAQAGAALQSSDSIAVTSVSFDLAKVMELVGEIRNAAGFGAPRLSGTPAFAVPVTVEFKNLADVGYFLGRDNGTEYKMDFRVSGDLIGGSNYNFFGCNFPRLKVVTDPSHSVNNTGENPYSVTFEALFAATNPTGMSSGYPMPLLQNSRAGRYLP